ncbi:hypothetical protein HQ487_01110 [Candidatus Uhrbacteria bacterium]|nr:hypothetical protein [Candidatus Uhrbacteria bacterium]
MALEERASSSSAGFFDVEGSLGDDGTGLYVSDREGSVPSRLIAFCLSAHIANLVVQGPGTLERSVRIELDFPLTEAFDRDDIEDTLYALQDGHGSIALRFIVSGRANKACGSSQLSLSHAFSCERGSLSVEDSETCVNEILSVSFKKGVY